MEHSSTLDHALVVLQIEANRDITFFPFKFDHVLLKDLDFIKLVKEE